MKTAFWIGVVVMAAFLVWSRPATAGRPFATEDAGVTGKGEAQLELGVDRVKTKTGETVLTFLAAPAYGLNGKSEASIETPYSAIFPSGQAKTRGPNDMMVAYKRLLREGGETGVAVATKAFFKLSNGDVAQGLGSGDGNVGFLFAFSRTKARLSWSGTAGYVFVGRKLDPTLENYLLHGLALEYEYAPRIKLDFEIYSESDQRHEATSFRLHNANVLFGAAFTISESIVLDVGFRKNITGDDPQNVLSVGASIPLNASKRH